MDLQDRSNAFDKAMLKTLKSDETLKITNADIAQDTAITAAQRQLSVYELSNDEAEVEAYISLKTVFDTYKGIQKWNYEEERNGIDNLLIDLCAPKYVKHIATLQMERYITRIATKAAAFKELFDNRIQETVGKEVFDSKVLFERHLR